MITIKPSKKNTNKHTEQGMQLLENSIDKVGVLESISVTKEGTIISGHARSEVFNSKGMKPKEIHLEANEYPVIVTDIEDNTKQYFEAQILANTTANKNFNLYAELIEEIAVEFDIDIDIEEVGVEVEEVQDETFLEAKEDDFDTTPPAVAITVLGDLYEIGEHRLLCGDSTDSDQVAKLMNGDKADMVFTDPPYNVSIGTIKHPKFKQREIENDSMSSEDFKEFCKGWASVIKLNCDGVIYCWAGQGKDGRVMFTVLDEYFHNSTTIIWVKDQFTLGRGKYQNQYEPCWFGWNKSGSSFTDNRKLVNVWNFQRPKKSELHPTMKPLELISEAINHNPLVKSLLDLFLGSGSTMVASHQLKRKCYGMELDPKYCDVIIKRMIKLDDSLTIKRNGIDCTNEFKE